MMNAPPVLYAKGRVASRVDVTLESHLRDTEVAAQSVFTPGSRLRERWLSFFKVHKDDEERFMTTLRVAALLHDIGKANRDFYDAVTHSAKGPQALRHEHLSAIVLFDPGVRQWLGDAKLIEFDVLVGAVLSHHMKAGRPDTKYAWCQPRRAGTLQLWLEHPEVRVILERIRAVANIGSVPPFPSGTWADRPPWSVMWSSGIQAANIFRRKCAKDPRLCSLLMATKTALVIADSVASALVREQRPFDWVDEVLHVEPLAPSDIDSILTQRGESISRRSGKPFTYHRFQELAGQQDARSLLLAACGAGKTIAAWRWARQVTATRPVSRVIFLYPTRGTATEGFRDYVGWAPDGESALVHGTARYELEAIAANPPESLEQKDARRDESDARLFALGHWSRRYFSATVDQFLSFIEHQYSSTCLLPLLVDSALIIDEVHSFDRRMFDDLIAFLKAFDVPVLAMTATLSDSRRRELEQQGLTAFPRAEHRADLADLEEQERHPRYELHPVANVDAALMEALNALEQGLRVLWVVNTVARCQTIAVRLETARSGAPLVYHSRFRLRDRQRVHASVVATFAGPTSGGGAPCAVSTQVCEMSLDLDADVLITELAPPSSLVQRFGRANRHRKRGDAFRARLVVYEPESTLPYSKSDLEATRGMLASLTTPSISQRDLSRALETHALGELRADGTAPLLTGGYFAIAGELRDIDDIATPCVLDSDLPDIRKARLRNEPIDAFILSAPRHSNFLNAPDWLPRYLQVVESSNYSEHLGFMVAS